jgi:hypothetical protein
MGLCALQGVCRLNVIPVTASCAHGDGTWVSVQCGELVEGLNCRMLPGPTR